jgi:hypothetical protein
MIRCITKQTGDEGGKFVAMVIISSAICFSLGACAGLLAGGICTMMSDKKQQAFRVGLDP